MTIINQPMIRFYGLTKSNDNYFYKIKVGSNTPILHPFPPMEYIDQVLNQLIKLTTGTPFNINTGSKSYLHYLISVIYIIDSQHDTQHGFSITFNSSFTKIYKEHSFIKKTTINISKAA